MNHGYILTLALLQVAQEQEKEFTSTLHKINATEGISGRNQIKFEFYQ